MKEAQVSVSNVKGKESSQKKGEEYEKKALPTALGKTQVTVMCLRKEVGLTLQKRM
jgi:hypothetical protein